MLIINRRIVCKGDKRDVLAGRRKRSKLIDVIWLTNNGIQMRGHAIIISESLQARDLRSMFIKGI